LTDEIDFERIRSLHRVSGSRDENWPRGVYAISLDALSLLGVDPDKNTLFWDGREIVVRRVIRLGSTETWLASIGVGTGFAALMLELGKTFLGWGG